MEKLYEDATELDIDRQFTVLRRRNKDRVFRQTQLLNGGRGTGKSTLLYFIWCALSNEPEESTTISTLLRANLSSGTITLNIQGANGKECTVTKTLGVEPLVTATQGEATITWEELRNYFDPEFFPALKIEDTGRNPVED